MSEFVKEYIDTFRQACESDLGSLWIYGGTQQKKDINFEGLSKLYSIPFDVLMKQVDKIKEPRADVCDSQRYATDVLSIVDKMRDKKRPLTEEMLCCEASTIFYGLNVIRKEEEMVAFIEVGFWQKDLEAKTAYMALRQKGTSVKEASKQTRYIRSYLDEFKKLPIHPMVRIINGLIIIGILGAVLQGVSYCTSQSKRMPNQFNQIQKIKE